MDLNPGTVAFFDDRYQECYGAQENLLLLAAMGTSRGWDCRLVTTHEGGLAAEARRRGIRADIIEAPPQLRTFEVGTIRGGLMNRLRSLFAWSGYTRTIDRQLYGEADVVVAGSVRAAIHLTRLAVRRDGPKLLLFAQNSIPFGVFAALAALISTRVLLIAPGAARTFPTAALRLVDRRIRDLPSGRDLSEYTAPARRPWGPDQPVTIVSVSSLTRRKALDLLVEAVGRVRATGYDCRLRVVGGTLGTDSERYARELEELAVELEVPLDLVGWSDDVATHLADADLFAMASRDEGLPGVLLEAMAAGLPCVSTEAGGAGALVSLAGCGVSVPIGDVDALADGLEHLLGAPEQAVAMGQAGQAYVERHHSLDAYFDRFVLVLEEIERMEGLGPVSVSR